MSAVRRRIRALWGTPSLDELGVPKDVARREQYVRDMFDSIAQRYDLLNRILSFGQDVWWRRQAARETAQGGARRVLDVATGTGDMAAALLHATQGSAQIVGVDIARRMMGMARAKLGDATGRDGAVRFVSGSALRLPFADGSFDAAMTAFSARNIPDLAGLFGEARRVVRPGGKVVCLEISHPRGRVWGALFRLYFYRLVPRVGRLFSGRGGPYDYLPRSLTGFPGQDELARVMESAGLERVRWVCLLGGVAAIHVGRVPEPPGAGGQASPLRQRAAESGGRQWTS